MRQPSWADQSRPPRRPRAGADRRRRAAGILGTLILSGSLLLGPLPARAQIREAVTDFAGPPGSTRPALAPTPDGGLLLTWFEPRPDGRHALRIAERRDGRWGPAATVMTSDRFFINWADFPSPVATSDGEWLVHWLEKTEAKPYAYHVRLSSSRDGGRSWSAPLTVHQDRSATEHGFVAMVPARDGSVSVAWLDGAQMKDSAGAMSLRAATWRPGGTVAGEVVLDPRTCECCQVSMARTASGLVAAYRDRSADEVRDIAVVRELGGRWSEPAIVHPDGWVWRACPVNGPAIDAAGQAVAVAWYTAAGGVAQVKAAFSLNGGVTFGPPVQIDQGNPLGRVQVRFGDDGDAVVVWLEARDDHGEWMARRVTRQGVARRPVRLAVTARTRDAGFSRMVAVGPEFFVSWGEPGPEARVQVVRLPAAALPLR